MYEQMESSIKSKDTVNEMLDTLSKTEGWPKLTDKQRQLIRLSLMATHYSNQYKEQTKALQQMQIDGKDVITIDGKPVAPEDISKRYKMSYENVNTMFCNGAVAVLEEELNPFKAPVPSQIPGFFDGDLWDPQSEEEIAAKFEDGEFPYVVHVFAPNNFHGNKRVASAHSFVVLGRDGEDFIVWEKMSQGMDYRVDTLHGVCWMYAPEQYSWAVRPLKIKQEVREAAE